MWPVRAHRFGAWAVAFAIAAVTLDSLAQISISPVVIEIDTPRRAAAVSVTNSGERSITLQSEALLWQQADGQDQFEASDALLVVPTIAHIPPNSTQIIRLMLRSPTPSALERSYRLVLDDITQAQAKTDGASISFKFTHSLPVMIAPSGKVRNALRWKSCAIASGSSPELTTPQPKEACVRLVNAGNRRIKMLSLVLTGNDWQQALSLKGDENILVGNERELRVTLQAGQTGPLRSVQVHTALGETLLAESGGF